LVRKHHLHCLHVELAEPVPVLVASWPVLPVSWPLLPVSWPFSLGSKSDDIVAEVGAVGALQGSANQRHAPLSG
jgi:hypothetical protein